MALAQNSLFGYIVKQGFKQGSLLLKAKPVTEVLKDESLDSKTRTYLVLSTKLLAYARDDLGQSTGRSYQKYLRLPRSWVTQLVIAAPKNSIDPYLFKYPIVGELPYKGFFDEEDALRLQKDLESQNFDTYRRPVEAFSTTGWLPDPILSTMLGKPGRFIELIFHELTHATFYFNSEADFNEAFASWMGFRGAIGFLESHPDAIENSAAVLAELKTDNLWQLRFAKLLKEVIAHSRQFYQEHSTASNEEREVLFKWIAARFAQEKDFPKYATFAWNNASLSALGTYYELVEPIDRYATNHKLSPKDFLALVKKTGPSIIKEITQP